MSDKVDSKHYVKIRSKRQSSCMCLVVQSCPTLCDPMGCSLQAPLSMGILQARITGVGCHALQGIFPTQGSNPGFWYCRRIVYCLSHQGSPRILEWVAYPFLQGIFRIQESNQSLLHCRRLFYQLSYQGSSVISIQLTQHSVYIYFTVYT